MAIFSQSGRWRLRRRHDILLDGCGVLAALLSSICSSICECACLCVSRRRRVSPVSEDSCAVEIALDGFESIAMMGILQEPNQSGPASQVPPTHNAPSNDDHLVNYEVTESSYCEALSSSLDSLSNDPNLNASTTEHIHERPNQSSPASQMPPTANACDYKLLNFKVNLSLDSVSNDPSPTASTTEDIHEGHNQSSTASQMPPTDNDTSSDDTVPNFKVTNSSSCKPYSSSLGSTSNELIGSNTVDARELLSHLSPASQMPPIYEGASTNERVLSFENFQSVGNMEDSMSGHDLNYTDSSSRERLPSSFNFLSSEPTKATTVDLADNKSISNE